MKKFQIITIFCCLLTISLLTCLKNKATEQIVEIKNGVKTIINPDEPITDAPVEYYELIEELSIGVDEGDSNYVFGRPTIGFVDQEKNIYVIDDMFYRVSKFDSTGKFIFSFGRKGQGPGEFQNILSFVLGKQGNIYISDMRNRRISIFDLSGNYLTDFKISSWESVVSEIDNDRLLLFISQSDYENKISNNIFKVYSIDKAKTDTLFLVEHEIFAVVNGGSRGSIGIKPFSFCFDKNYNFYIISDDKYMIQKYDVQGNLVAEFNRKYKSVALTKEDKMNYFTGSVTLNGVKYSPPVPDYRYDIYKIFSMPNNELWVMTSTVDKKFGRLFDVFDTQGNYIRKFFLKTELNRYRIDFWDKKIYSYFETEEGFPGIKRYGLKKVEN